MLLRDIIERYRRDVLPTFAERTQKDYHRHLDFLIAKLGDRDADDVKPRDIGALLDVPTGKIQRNRQVSVLSAIYSKAVGRWFVAEKNPCLRVERNPSKPRDRYINHDEYRTIYRRAPEPVQIAMDLALLTGQRQGDIVGMKWSQVTPEGITIRQSKTGKRMRITMSLSLMYVLRRAKRRAGSCEYVIPTSFGKRYTPEGFRALWQRVMRQVRSDKALVAPATFHDIRAKCVSDSASLEDAMKRAGHTSMAMTRGTYDRGIRDVRPLQ